MRLVAESDVDFSQHAQEALDVFLGLGFANAMGEGESPHALRRLREERRHLAKRTVARDEIGRNVLDLRDCEAMRARALASTSEVFASSLWAVALR